MSSKNVPDEQRRPWSLAARLTAWYAASAFLILLAATGVLYWALDASLDRDDDGTLADRVLALRVALRHQPADADSLRREAEATWVGPRFNQFHTRILGENGNTIVQTPGMDLLPVAVFPPPSETDGAPGPGTDWRSADGTPFRLVAARAVVGGPRPAAVVVQLALDRSQEDELLSAYRGTLWLVLAAGLAASGLVGYRIARRGLRPVQEIAATARRIRPATLGERLATAGLPAELLALAGTFNDMLDRLEGSFDRLARFSADVGHELRTPVNILRGEAEVALGKPRSAEEYRDVLGSCLEECARLSRLIDSLLFLARAENPRTQVEREAVDVGRELEAVRDFYEAAAAEAGVALKVQTRGETSAWLNRPLLQRAVGNLLANALAHTPPGGSVALTATREDDGVRIEVADTGCGIAAVHLPHLFDRFYRVDPARASGGGLGLGLSIVKSIAELHDGSVAVASEVGRGTRVTLLFPAARLEAGG